MKTKNTIFLLIFFTIQIVFSQTSINDYKYVIVPNKFDIFKEADKYQLNSITHFLLNKHGFEAYLKDEKLPNAYMKNNCLALTANVIENSSMFKTKLQIELKNCNGEVVYTSAIGESRSKKYKVAYNEALRNAFNSMNAINYKYTPKINTAIAEEEVKTEAQQLEITEQVITKKEEVKADNIKPSQSLNKLYAQKIKNGFQIVDKTPKVVYTILNTGKPDVFIVKNKEAVIYKLNNKWVIAQIVDNNLQLTTLDIKF